MERLWAPWRMEYVTEKIKGCIFCRAARARAKSKSLVVFQDSLILVMLNKYPYNNGHLMLAPLRHVGEWDALFEKEIAALGFMLKQWVKVLKKLYKPGGFNVGMNLGSCAGAGVKGHLHMHVVPRWTGDTNYMPVVGKTKVLLEMLDTTYARCVKAWKEMQA